MKRIKRNFFLVFFLMLVACSKQEVTLEKEIFTHEVYYKGKINNLIATKNCEKGDLILKCSERLDPSQTKSIKAILSVHHEGRDYDINPQEVLSLSIDGTPYPLEIINSYKAPVELKETYFFPLPSARCFSLGKITETTIRKISFLLPFELFSKLSTAHTAFIEISSPVSTHLSELSKYPINLGFNQENFSLIQDLKNKCFTKK